MPVAPAGAVDELPGGVVGVAAMDEQEGDRGLLGRRKQLVEQRERCFVRPVEILEHQTQRAFSCDRADELVEPVERLVLDGVAREVAQALLLLRLERQPEQGGEEGIGLLCVVGERAGELRAQLQTDARLGIGNAQTEPGAEQLAHRPVRDRLGVGDGVAGEEADAPGEALLQLGDEARLADPGLAGDRGDRSPSFGEPVRAVRSMRRAPARGRRAAAPCVPRALRGRSRRGRRSRARSSPSTRGRRAASSSNSPPTWCAVDRPHHQLASRLQARGNVDRCRRARRRGRRGGASPAGTTTGPVLTATRAASSIPYAGGDLGAVVGERFVDREGRADGALGVVLVRDGRAEERQDAVAGQLRDRSAEALDLLAHQPRHVVEEELRPLGAELLGDRRRAGDVCDEDRDDPPLACRLARLGRADEVGRNGPSPSHITLDRRGARPWFRKRRRKAGFLAQDRRLQLTQGPARFDPELGDERLSRLR